MQPMLAETIKDISLLEYPVYISGKLDGYRCLKVNGQVVSRNLKQVANNHTRTWMEKLLPEGADGEALCGTFSETSSAMKRVQGTPNVQFFWFDWILPGVPFLERQERMRAYHAKHFAHMKDKVVFWESIPCPNPETLLKAEAAMLGAGLEGVMVRKGDAPYKHGRSSLKQGYLLKLKRFADAEAEIIGFQEEMTNGNEATKDALGHTLRSSKKAGLVQKGTLGAFLVRDCKTGVEFGIGTGVGLTHALRQKIWQQRDELLGELVKYKYQELSKDGVPRFPVYLGIRDKNDL